MLSFFSSSLSPPVSDVSAKAQEASPGGITYEVEVAINGQDFIGGSPPVLVRFVTATAIVTVEPANVSALGHLPLTVAGASTRVG